MKCCGHFRVNPGINNGSIVAFFTLSFVSRIWLEVPHYQMIFKSPDYYDEHGDKTASRWANIAKYNSFFTIPALLLSGPMYDLFGRKWPLVIIQTTSAIAFVLIP